MNTGLVDPYIFPMNISGNKDIFALAGGTGEGVQHGHLYKLSDNGNTWSKTIIDHSEVFMPSLSGLELSPNFEEDQTIFVGNRHYGKYSLYKSVNAGLNFSPVNIDVENVYPIAFSNNWHSDNTVYVGTEKGIFKSLDRGESWVSSGLADLFILSINITNDNTIFASTVGQGVFKSIDSANSWMKCNQGLPKLAIMDLASSPYFVSDKILFAATLGHGIYKSTNGGASWSYSGLKGNYINDIELSPYFEFDETLFTSTWDGVYMSQSGGESWFLITSLVRYEEDHQTFIKTGKWVKYLSDECSSSKLIYSYKIGDSLSFSFWGNTVRWIGTNGPEHGSSNVYIDNIFQHTINLNSDTTIFQKTIFELDGLPIGLHEIKIENIGGVSGNIVTIDAIDVFDN
jgi:hypothetical protein